MNAHVKDRFSNKLSSLKLAFDQHTARKDRYKKILAKAAHTSSHEILESVFDLKNGISPTDLLNIGKQLTNAGTWIGHSYLRYLISHANFKHDGNKPSRSEEEEIILDHLINNIPLNERFSHAEIFKTIYNEREFQHYYPNYKSPLRIPKTNITMVLISGVFNEIFSTAAFERGAAHMSENLGVKYFAADVHGSKDSDHNSELIKEQLDKYILENPNEKLWLFCFSKGGVDSLRFLNRYSDFANRHVVGFSAVASPILGSDHVNNKLVSTISKIHELKDSKIYHLINERGGILAKAFQDSLSSTHQRVWFRKNHKTLPKNPFYSAVAFEASWYESHLWMMLTKVIFKSAKSNDGIVDAENALFPSYFNGLNLGILKGHHLVGTRSSFYCQEALLESHIIIFKYLGLLD